MKPERLKHLLDAMRPARVAIVGDFFLDAYLIIDPRLQEVSIETGLPAHQVVELRPSPGAAGSVATKVAALGVQTIHAVTMLGDDGNGYDLAREMRAVGVRFEHVVTRPDRFTPTYGKPMLRRPNGTEEEISRIDIKNRRPAPREVEDSVIGSLRTLAPEVDGIIVIDQVEQRNCGVVTDRVREELASLGAEQPRLFILADSRSRVAEFRNIMIKPNVAEAARALGMSSDAENAQKASEMAGSLAQMLKRNVFLTMGPEGIAAADTTGAQVIPAFPVTGMIDTTGAGDTVTAGIVSALCAGASVAEAAEVGNLAAAITIKQLGTTGTATPQQMMAALEEYQ